MDKSIVLKLKKTIFRIFFFMMILVSVSFAVTTPVYANDYASWFEETEDSEMKINDTAGSLDTGVEEELNKDPAWYERIFSGFVRIIVGGLAQVLEYIGATNIDKIIFGKNAPGETVSSFSFGFEVGNLYGTIGAILYSVLRGIVFAVLAVQFMWMLVTDLIYKTGSSRASMKDNIYNFIFMFIMLYAVPILVKLLLLIRDGALQLIVSVTKSIAVGGGTGMNLSLVYIFSEIAIEDQRFLSACLWGLAMASTLYLMWNYINIAIKEMFLFGVFPAVVARSFTDKTIFSKWVSWFCVQLFIPLLDSIGFMACVLVYHSGPSNQLAKAFITWVVFTSIIPCRELVLGLFGVPASMRRSSLVGLAMMARLLAGNFSSRSGKGTSNGKGGEGDNATKNKADTDSVHNGQSNRTITSQEKSNDTLSDVPQSQSIDSMDEMVSASDTALSSNELDSNNKTVSSSLDAQPNEELFDNSTPDAAAASMNQAVQNMGLEDDDTVVVPIDTEGIGSEQGVTEPFERNGEIVAENQITNADRPLENVGEDEIETGKPVSIDSDDTLSDDVTNEDAHLQEAGRQLSDESIHTSESETEEIPDPGTDSYMNEQNNEEVHGADATIKQSGDAEQISDVVTEGDAQLVQPEQMKAGDSITADTGTEIKDIPVEAQQHGSGGYNIAASMPQHGAGTSGGVVFQSNPIASSVAQTPSVPQSGVTVGGRAGVSTDAAFHNSAQVGVNVPDANRAVMAAAEMQNITTVGAENTDPAGLRGQIASVKQSIADSQVGRAYELVQGAFTGKNYGEFEQKHLSKEKLVQDYKNASRTLANIAGGVAGVSAMAISGNPTDMMVAGMVGGAVAGKISDKATDKLVGAANKIAKMPENYRNVKGGQVQRAYNQNHELQQKVKETQEFLRNANDKKLLEEQRGNLEKEQRIQREQLEQRQQEERMRQIAERASSYRRAEEINRKLQDEAWKSVKKGAAPLEGVDPSLYEQQRALEKNINQWKRSEEGREWLDWKDKKQGPEPPKPDAVKQDEQDRAFLVEQIAKQHKAWQLENGEFDG